MIIVMETFKWYVVYEHTRKIYEEGDLASAVTVAKSMCFCFAFVLFFPACCNSLDTVDLFLLFLPFLYSLDETSTQKGRNEKKEFLASNGTSGYHTS